jgi:hypothetical protein
MVSRVVNPKKRDRRRWGTGMKSSILGMLSLRYNELLPSSHTSVYHFTKDDEIQTLPSLSIPC